MEAIPYSLRQTQSMNSKQTLWMHYVAISIRKATFRQSRRSGMPRLPDDVTTRTGVTWSVMSHQHAVRLIQSSSADRVTHEETEDNLEALFGIWRDRDIPLAGIREKAWRQP